MKRKKDYEMIAGVIREQVNATSEKYALGMIDKVDAETIVAALSRVTGGMARELARLNDNFDYGRFIDACGLGEQ